MKCVLSIIGLAAGLSVASVANATVTTWSFGATGSATQVGQGTTYSGVGGAGGSITVFGVQVNNSSGNIVSTSDSTINGLFAVNDSPNFEGIGIAPYDPAEGNSNSFANQDGITDVVDGNSSIGNVLEVELGSNIAQGTSLSFLLQAGIGASSDQVEFWSADASTPQNTNSTSMTHLYQTPLGAISTSGTTAQYTLTKNTSGTEFVAIEADCHYILLDTITGTPGAVPEPRFYGILLAAFLGLAGIAYKRRAAQVNA